MTSDETKASEPRNFYVGIAGLPMTGEEFDLAGGVRIRRLYAHMIDCRMMSYSEGTPEKPLPTPVKVVRGGSSIDVSAEVAIPSEAVKQFGDAREIAAAVVFTLRLGVTPAASLAAVSNAPITVAHALDEAAWVAAVESEPRKIRLETDGTFGESEAAWVAARWPAALRLSKESAEFALAVDALSIGQYIHRSALTLVALWAALEALFSPSTSELRFRVSSLIAAYLETPGESRRQRALEVGKLYDKRSAAAHGKPTHEMEHLLATFNLLREVATKILDDGHVPTKAELEQRLYGEASPPAEARAASA